MNWTHILLPFDSVKAWGIRGVLRVKGEINGFQFRTSIFPTGDGHHMMVVNKQMQKRGRVTPGAHFPAARKLLASRRPRVRDLNKGEIRRNRSGDVPSLDVRRD